ncbi:MAG: TauD/TfdA family dioxygenase [Gammaproteobacteria bacterium]|nr:MAG: TauD/TfdA family dioxygenase [Gammaproteobacteria bacterium]
MLNVKPLSIHIGAEIHDVDLTKPLATDQISDIKTALLQWKVVFFRNQPLNHRQHIDFARQFGEPTPGHVVFGGDKTYPEIYSIAKERTANRNRHLAPLRPWTGWHTDITAAINPPWASILRSDVVPLYGGDTHWTNLAAAFASLSPALQKFVETLHAEHRLALGEQTLASIHPLVRVHPETGERVLYVSPSFVKSVTGLKPHESQKLLELLWEQAIRPEYTVRFKWEPGSIAFWDNRSTAHLAPTDIFDSDFERQFYRVTLVGDVPVGVDGELSRSVAGNPIGAAAKPSVESSA